jgi:PKHD-type hydroxylase
MAHLPLWSIGQLKEDLCDQIIAEMSGIGEAKDASMGFDGSEKDHATRNTTVRFGDQTYWANDVFESFALHANKECKWDYDINHRENIQFAEYGPEQHYSWHTDTFTLSGNATDRKITTVCLLNDDFEGGQFQVRLYGEFTAPLKKGTIIAFPAILEHRVIPVTSGIRYSATMWFGGPRFR